MAARRRGVEARVLPVDHGRAADDLRSHLADLGPNVLLLTGHASDPVPRLERVGRAGPLSPHGGPGLRRGRWPWADAHAEARGRGLPLRASFDAGRYVCDTTYWAALGTGVPLVAFLHLPAVGPVWTPHRAARAVEAVLVAAL
ncbi:MAG: hypothetical protein GTN90_04195 [Xanthomonadales bacterium]|nr:hypothetical protein [Xanthomonadales bacterium]